MKHIGFIGASGLTGLGFGKRFVSALVCAQEELTGAKTTTAQPQEQT